MQYFKGQTVPAHKTSIMVHCLATSKQWGENKSAAAMVKIVHDWHTRDRGWSAIGYAGIIDPTGGFALGRDLDRDGNVLEETAAAARGWNTNAIHIALAGGRGSDERDNFSDHYTFQQGDTLRAIIAEINQIAGRELALMGHNEVAAKACPGFNVTEWYTYHGTVLTQRDHWHTYHVTMPTQHEPSAPLAVITDKPSSPWDAFFADLTASFSSIFGGKK